MGPSLLILLSVAAHAWGSNPAIKAVLTDKGLQYGTHVGTDWLQARIRALSIPDISGDVSLRVLGSIHYTLSGMSVAQLNLPAPTMVFSEGTGVRAALSGLSVAVRGNWNIQFHVITGSGTLDMALFKVDVSSLTRVGSDEQGHLSVSSAQCNSSIGGLQITFHGQASSFFQRFVKYLKCQIKSQIEEKICLAVKQGIEDVENYLAASRVSFQVNPALLLDMPLLSSPVVQASDINLNFKGEFYSVQSHTEPPFVANPFQLPRQDNFMVTLGASEFCVNSAAFAYFSAGLLQINITDDMIPSESPIRLNTTRFGVFVPQLPKMFPDMLMLVHTYASDTPMISFLPDNTTLRLSGSAKAYAIKPDSSLAPLFRLDLDARFSGKFMMVDGKLKGSLMMNNLTLMLGASEVGTFQTTSLEEQLKVVVNMTVLPKVNGEHIP
ncbi:hypothetical protein AAFF_G00298400 [Aldrovandia affinis]|uniref:Bactericidal permeability-increasing protein n=1 Tax=Aldrovandia affinis TaxID=143900 RepID=A0AAD7R9G5_9TELE|nr:hypothetical protein AAFF_G00298400 [Aldrovandia affinis]